MTELAGARCARAKHRPLLVRRGERAPGGGGVSPFVIAGPGLPDDLPVLVHLFFFQLARGRLAVMTDAPDRGVEDLLELGRRTQLVPFDNPADFPWRRYAVEGLLRLGRTEEAVALAREELEIAQRWGASPTVAACLRTLGNALGGDEGEALLRQAVAIAADSPARVQHARALVDLGAALRRRNKRVEARERLREGAALAYRAGTAALVERANEELAATGRVRGRRFSAASTR